jgi:L-cysteine desulfidase
MTASAVDARMAGLNVRIMTSSGSGNQGIVTTLPTLAAAELVQAERVRLGKAVALAHLLLARMSAELGLLTPLCGSAVQAAAAASAAITWLLGGSAEQVEQAAAVTLASQATVLCDGAKASCAIKAAQGAGVATEIALLTIDGLNVGPGNGLIGPGLLETLRDVRLIAEDLKSASQHVLESITRNAC